MTTMRQQIVALSERADGVTSLCMQTILGLRCDSICSNMVALEQQGRVVRANVEGNRLRWFAFVADRDNWMAAKAATLLADRAVRDAANVARIAANSKRRADKDKAAALAMTRHQTGLSAPSSLAGTVYTAGGSKIAPAVRGAPIITSDTKITIVPRPDVCARWQAQPSQPAAGFATMGIGRYL